MRLKLASLAFEISFISNWFGAQIKFTWGSIKVYVRFTSDSSISFCSSNEAETDSYLYLVQVKKNSVVECSVSVVFEVTLHSAKWL